MAIQEDAYVSYRSRSLVFVIPHNGQELWPAYSMTSHKETLYVQVIAGKVCCVLPASVLIFNYNFPTVCSLTLNELDVEVYSTKPNLPEPQFSFWGILTWCQPVSVPVLIAFQWHITTFETYIFFLSWSCNWPSRWLREPKQLMPWFSRKCLNALEPTCGTECCILSTMTRHLKHWGMIQA